MLLLKLHNILNLNECGGIVEIDGLRVFVEKIESGKLL